MDLSTIGEKLKDDEYTSVADFRLDVQTTFCNLLAFNNDPMDTQKQFPDPRAEAYCLLNLFQATYPDYSVDGKRGMDVELKRQCRQRFEKLLLHRKQEEAGKVRTCGPFVVPVLSLGLPGYKQKVAKPVDLCHVLYTLNTDGYDNVEQFDADVELTFKNAITYGEGIAYEDPDTHVHCPVATLAKAGLVYWALLKSKQ